MANLTAGRLKELFDCNPVTGEFVRRFPRNGSPAGKVVGRAAVGRYVVISADGKFYKAHRLVWLYVHGQMPDCDIDHIDGDKANNRISNLRLATKSQNKANEKLRRDNSSGFKGAKPHMGRWQARIFVGGKRMSLGYYSTAAQAHEAYLNAARLHFGEFARAS